MSDQVWLELDEIGGAKISVGIPREEAMTMDRRGFAKLYRKTVHGSSRRTASRWAAKQVEERERAINSSPRLRSLRSDGQ